MDVHETVTLWLDQLKGGDPAAAERLWQRYFGQIAGLARKKLGSTARKVADEEDVALSVFDSLCRGVKAGNFPQLTDHESLWPLLVVLTVRKACDQINHERRLKRGGGLAHAETDIGVAVDREDEVPFRLDMLLSHEPSPEFAVMMDEACDELLKQLDSNQCDVAIGKLQGHSNQELAEKLGCGLRTIERRLELIRRI